MMAQPSLKICNQVLQKWKSFMIDGKKLLFILWNKNKFSNFVFDFFK